jgi:glycosyltransferase involved in cell wall biosynthesis
MEENQSRRLRVLMSAFACEPFQGSEPEVGWQWAVQMARFHDVTVVTQSKNRANIERALVEVRKKQLVPTFVYFDREKYLQRLRKWRSGLQLYCVLWHRAARVFIGSLHQAEPFDLMHHVTIAGFRYQTAIWGHGVPSIWGPIGGIESSPVQLLPWRHLEALLPELARNIHNKIQNWPFSSLRYRLGATTVTLASTGEMQQLIEGIGYKVQVMPTIGLRTNEIAFQPRAEAKGPLRLLFVGNLIALKGVHLAVEALARSGTDATLTLIGTGNMQRAMEKRAERLGLSQRIKFLGRLSREGVMNAYRDFDILIFPSFHDTGGYAVIEAMCNGLPVICLDCGGPAIAVRDGCGAKVPIGSYRAVVGGLSAAIQKYGNDRALLLEHSRAARAAVLENYDWDRKGEQMAPVYKEAVTKWDSKRLKDGFSEATGLSGLIHRLVLTRGIAASLMLMIAISLLGFSSVSLLKKRAQVLAEDAVPGLSYAGEADFNLSQGFNRTLLMLLAQNKEQRERYHAEADEFVHRTAESLRSYETSIFNAEDRKLYDRVVSRRESYERIRQQLISLLQQDRRAEGEELCRSSLVPAYDQYKLAGESLFSYNVKSGQRQGNGIFAMGTITQLFVAILGVMLFIAGFVVGFLK